MKGSEMDSANNLRAMAADEQDLLARACRREPAALAALFHRFHDSAVGFAYLRLRNRDEAEEAVQEAWTRAIRSIDQFRGAGKFSTWLFTIVLNECRRLHRQSWKRLNVSLDAALSSGHPETLRAVTCPDRSAIDYERKQTNKRLRQEIGRLPLVYRSILSSRYVSGRSLSQVAIDLNISQQAAKSRIMRARAELRAKLNAVHQDGV